MAPTERTWRPFRSRRLAVATIGTAVVVLIGGASAYLATRSEPTPTRVFGEATTPSTTEAETTTTTVAPSTTAEPATSTTATTEPARSTTSTPRVTTTTALVCRNSYDARCGPFRWDPDPGPNQPSTAQIDLTPTNPRVGDVVALRVTFTNPDGPAGSIYTVFDYGDGLTTTLHADPPGPPYDCKTPYGPWTPPRREAQTVSFDWPGHSYKAAGTYTLTVTGNGGWDPCPPENPYRDSKSASTTITVRP